MVVVLSIMLVSLPVSSFTSFHSFTLLFEKNPLNATN